MANIWNATLEPNNNVKQNVFDWTHVNNLTTQIGRITPIQCELVPAKTSFRAKPIPALQLMPMVFPVQTRMRASIAYFRYPLRALWKDYKDFIGNFREGLEEPYHNFNNQSMIDKMLGTGKLMDYLGIPTTFVGDFGSVGECSPTLDDSTSYGLIPFSVPSATMHSNIGAPIPSIVPKYSAYNTFGYYRTVEYVFDSLVSFLANDGGRPISISLVSGPESSLASNFRLALYDSSGSLLKVLKASALSSDSLAFETIAAIS